ncbi:hypothetical protein CBS101457_006691 [Exobasidium rhododendri]|nr:hypothetical protein CBS101457_006691 [Exobasidium rhododendri]
MALIIVSGLACSGKTRRCKELIIDFERRNASLIGESSSSSSSHSPLRIIHLRNKDANIVQSQFSTQVQEKPARAAYLSLVMRNLAKNTIVIADGGAGTNIKGFRYQMWCAAREVGVRSLSILCVAGPQICKERNRSRRSSADGLDDEEAYDEKTLDELLMRFEEPNPMTRWDSPLFVLDCNQEDKADYHWEAAPFDAIWEAITKGKLTKAPDVVAPIRGTSSNYLSLLESTTQIVLSSFHTMASFGTLPDTGGLIQLSMSFHTSDSSSFQLPLYLPVGKKAPTTAALQRLRRQFIKMHASGASAHNELGQLSGQEGGRHVDQSTASSRAERKAQQNSESSTHLPQPTPKSVEEGIARRFTAYLEETL